MKKLDLTQDEAIIHLQVLRKEIDILRSRLQAQDTGHIHTAIGVLEDRLRECTMTIFTERKGG
jgi:hypothetical protein